MNGHSDPKVEIQPLLSEVHSLKQLFILAGRLDILLLYHSVHVIFVLLSNSLEPVQRVELQILIQ